LPGASTPTPAPGNGTSIKDRAMSHRRPWKIEYAICKQESRDAFEWHDDLPSAIESAEDLSRDDPDNVYIIEKIEHYEDVRTDVRMFSNGERVELDEEA
jgi:hypothetical protein